MAKRAEVRALREQVERLVRNCAKASRVDGAIGYEIRRDPHPGVKAYRHARSWWQWHVGGRDGEKGTIFPEKIYWYGNWRRIESLTAAWCREILELEWEPARPKHPLELLAECAD